MTSRPCSATTPSTTRKWNAWRVSSPHPLGGGGPRSGGGGPMPRIVLLGCAGAGKSTLAKRLSAATDAPLICLDGLCPGGLAPSDVPAFRNLMTELHAGDPWISDGNFALATFD